MKELNVILPVHVLPAAYTWDGENKSPPLEVHGIDNTISRSLAMIVNDPDAPGGHGFIHWIIWNMELVSVVPEDIPKDPVVTFPISAVQGTNSAGKTGYRGPCPPSGSTHRYEFKVYGMDTFLDIPQGSEKEVLVRAMQGHVVQFGETKAQYGR